MHGTLLSFLDSHFVLLVIYGLEALHSRVRKDSQNGNLLQKHTSGTAELALFRSKGLKATELKDMTYAMLWAFPHSSDGIKRSLHEVDYSKPVDVIYTGYTTAILLEEALT